MQLSFNQLSLVYVGVVLDIVASRDIGDSNQCCLKLSGYYTCLGSLGSTTANRVDPLFIIAVVKESMQVQLWLVPFIPTKTP